VIGFDNVWVDDLIAVPLTSIDGKAMAIGREAGRLLAQRMDEPFGAASDAPSGREAIQIVVRPELVIRESCGCSATST
jgi:DNA-binding LacI/PurR family transcriptional regulator